MIQSKSPFEPRITNTEGVYAFAFLLLLKILSDMISVSLGREGKTNRVLEALMCLCCVLSDQLSFRKHPWISSHFLLESLKSFSSVPCLSNWEGDSWKEFLVFFGDGL